MTARNAAVAVVLSLVTLAACGGRRVLVPPRVQLAPYHRLGLVTFTIENAKGTLHQLATQRFAEHLLAAQSGFEVLELGEQGAAMDAAAARRLGQEHGVAAVFAGHVVVSDVRPRASLTGGLRVGAEVSVAMTVRLLSAESGGTLWTRSARTRETVAALSIVGGEPVFGAHDPNEAYGDLVNRLVYRLTHDFRPTYQ